jgi:hypothetical protein
MSFGEPKDVDGECNARLYIADNFGDSHATMRCQLPSGHEGPHKEEYKHYGKPVIVTWEGDDRVNESEFGGDYDDHLEEDFEENKDGERI